MTILLQCYITNISDEELTHLSWYPPKSSNSSTQQNRSCFERMQMKRRRRVKNWWIRNLNILHSWFGWIIKSPSWYMSPPAPMNYLVLHSHSRPLGKIYHLYMNRLARWVKTRSQRRDQWVRLVRWRGWSQWVRCQMLLFLCTWCVMLRVFETN